MNNGILFALIAAAAVYAMTNAQPKPLNSIVPARYV